MNEEEKKAFKVINTRTRRLLDELEIEKEDMSDEPKIAYLMQEIRANKIILNLVEKLQKENELAKQALIKNCNIADERNQLLEENEKLKNKLLDTLEGQKVIEEETPQYIKENYIPVEKVKDKIEELNSRIEKYREYVEQGIETNVDWVDNVADRETVKVLQELIKEREEES